MKFNLPALKLAIATDTLPRGYLMDAAVASLVCGWKLGPGGAWYRGVAWTGYDMSDFRPSTDENAAALLMVFFTSEQREVLLDGMVKRLTDDIQPEQVPGVMCLAALEAVLYEGENETEFADGSIVTREVAFSRDYLEELERGDFKPKQTDPTVKMVISLTCVPEGDDDLTLNMTWEAFLLEGKSDDVPELAFARWVVKALPELYKHWAEQNGIELVIIDDTETTVVDGVIDEGNCGRDCSCTEPKC